jgi:hypothetical protein
MGVIDADIASSSRHRFTAVRKRMATFDVSLPTGGFRYYLALPSGGSVTCTTTAYIAVLAGHQRHEIAFMMTGTADPFTASIAAGDFPFNGSASAIYTPARVGCGSVIENAVLYSYSDAPSSSYVRKAALASGSGDTRPDTPTPAYQISKRKSRSSERLCCLWRGRPSTGSG